MKQKHLFILAYLLTLALITSSFLFIYHENLKARALAIETTKDLIWKEFTVTTDNYERFSKLLYDMNINQKGATWILAEGVKVDDAQTQAIYRSELHRRLLPIFEHLHDNGFRNIHFYTADNVSYLRMHEPDRFGDAICSKRAPVAMVNETLLPFNGFVDGNFFSGYRYIFPVFHGDEHIGAVEISISMHTIISQLQENFNRLTLFLLSREEMDIDPADFKQTAYTPWTVDPGFMIDKERGRYDFIETGLSPIDRERVIRTINERRGSQEPFAIEVTWQGRKKLILCYPVYNYSEASVGYILTLSHSRDLLLLKSSITRTMIGYLVLILVVTGGMALYYRSKEDWIEALDQLSIITEGTNTGWWEWYIPTGKVRYRKRLVENLGYRMEETTSDTSWLREKVHPEDLEKIEQGLYANINGESDHCEIVHRLKTRDGKWRWFSHYGKVVKRDHNRQAVKMINSLRDITKQVRDEQELIKADKLNSIGLLAGGIAHDFNNILTGVYGNISMAKYVTDEEHPGYEHLEETEKTLERATKLTNQLLTFSRGGKPVMREVEITSILKETIRFDLSGSSLKPVFDLPDDHLYIMCDLGQIQQVISNLATNARQAMPDGGALHVFLREVSLGRHEIDNLEAGRYAMLTIQDEGCGIDEVHLEKIFEPYFTTKPTGNGLGLATTYSIIEKHHGLIRVSSVVGVGTTFTIYLPAVIDSPAMIDEVGKEKDPSRAAIRGTKVLVMDDERIILKISEKMLSSLGCESYSVSNGKDAITAYTKAKASGKPFDLLIMDLTIPGGIGGREAIRRLLELDPEVKAIVSSGYSSKTTMADYRESGFRAMIAKPYSRSQLEAVLISVLDD